MSDTPDESKNQMSGTQRSTADDELLVRDNIQWMLSLSNSLLRDSALAQDAVQDAFISAFRGLDKFESRSSIKTWLHRITVNAALTKLRQIKRRAEQPIDDYMPQFDQNDCRLESPWTNLSSVQTILESESLRAQVNLAIVSLPDNYRIVMQLRNIEGYDTAEVADALGISESNVKVRLHRARAALKKLLEPMLRGELIS